MTHVNLSERVNALEERVEKLEEFRELVEKPYVQIDSTEISEYLDLHPELRRPGGVIRCKSVHPFIPCDEESPDPRMSEEDAYEAAHWINGVVGIEGGVYKVE